MGTLKAKQRKKLPPSDFAGPDRTYPDQDKAHARDALGRAAQNASPAVQAEVKRNVAKKYPSIQVSGIKQHMKGA